MARTWRVAVIGRTGKGGYGHGLDVVWQQFDNVEIVAIADENEQGRNATARKINAKSVYADYREMLAKEKPHIVSIGDRFLDLHRDMVLACAEHGANIFLEKPMCRTLAEADEMLAACEKHHVKLAIALQTRYSPRIDRVKEMIADGKLGDILEMRGRGKEDNRGGGEDLMVLGTHIMDLMRFFAGDPNWCHSRIWHAGKPAQKGDIREGGEGMGPILGDRIHAQYGFANGIVGSFGTHQAKFGAGKRFAMQIFGTKGVIHLQTGSLPPVLFCEDPSWLPGRGNATWQEVTSNGLGKPETLKEIGGLTLGNVWIVKDLMDAIEKDRPPRGSGYDGRAALEMVLAVYESHRQDRAVDLPLKNRKHPLATA
jgi:predicted dehydrogenase